MELREVDEFYERQEEPLKSCFLSLRKYISEYHPNIEHVMKYKMPCFTLESKPFCYLWKDKKSNWPYVLLVKGHMMNHPKLEQGDRSKMKRLLINPKQDLDLILLHEILDQAASFYKK